MSDTSKSPAAENPAGGLGGIPGMDSTAAANLLGELRSDVAVEAAPMLVWLGKHAKKLFALFFLLIALILAYGAWQWHSEKVRSEAQTKLGGIILIQDASARLAGLEAYLAEAPADMQPGIRLEIAMNALSVGDHAKAAAAYDAVRKHAPDSAMGIAAAMNQASLLIGLNKPEEAVSVLAETENHIPDFMQTQFGERKAFALEQAGRKAEALALYETLAGKSVNADNDFFRYKVNVLRSELGK